MASVKKPGVNNNAPATNNNIPSNTCIAGERPLANCWRYRANTENPCARTNHTPSMAVARINKIVANAPIAPPMVINK